MLFYVVDSCLGVVNREGTGRHIRHSAPARRQRARCAGWGAGQGAAAAKGGRAGAGTLGHATTDPRLVWLLFVAPPEYKIIIFIRQLNLY